MRLRADVACGTPRPIGVKGLTLLLHRWGREGHPPALLLHSLAAHSHWWDWTAPRLAERLDVAALAFRGHGASDHATPPAYRFEDYAADVVAVLDALGWTACGQRRHDARHPGAGRRRSLPRGEAAEIPEAYHHLVLDAPDAFAATVLGWLDRVTGRARC